MTGVPGVPALTTGATRWPSGCCLPLASSLRTGRRGPLDRSSAWPKSCAAQEDVCNITNGINQALAELMDDMDRAAFEAACPIDEPVRPDRSKDPDSSSKRRRKPADGARALEKSALRRQRNPERRPPGVQGADRCRSVAQVFGTTAVVAAERPPVPLKQWPASAAAAVLMNWDTHYFGIQLKLRLVGQRCCPRASGSAMTESSPFPVMARSTCITRTPTLPATCSN